MKCLYFSIQIVILFVLIIIKSQLFLFADINPDGSFSTTVKIKLPPGRNGVQPTISLNYNSNTGNGIIGQGWSLSGLSSIVRDSSYPVNYDDNDHYSGPNGHLFKNNKYYHHLEENYSRFEAIEKQGGGPRSWIEHQPDGTKCHYGTTDDSQVYSLNHPDSIRVWALQSVEDINGNSYKIEYMQDQGQYYPVKIIYTMGDGISKYNVVEFDYEDNRSDVEISYLQSSKVVTGKRLKDITVKYNVASILGYKIFGDIVRKYQLDYIEDGLVSQSKLVKIHEFGSNGGELPGTEYEYDSSNDPVTFSNSSSVPWSGYDTSLGTWLDGDIDGDGRLDLFHVCYFWFWEKYINILFSNGDGTYTIPKLGYIPFSGYDTGFGQWVNGDYNGDGKTDLFHAIPVMWGQQYINTWLSNGDGTFNVLTFNPGGNYPTSGRWISADVNGDGRTDMVHLRGATPIYYFNSWISKGDGNYEMKYFQLQNHLNRYAGAILFYYGGAVVPVAAGDFNGDGKDDFTIVWFGESPDFPQVDIATLLSRGDGSYHVVHYYPSNNFRITRIAADDIGRPGIQFLVGDFNGDGKSDILLGSLNKNISALLLSKGDGTYDPRMGSTDGIGYDLGNWGIADINKDGKSDVVHYIGTTVNVWLSNGNGNFIFHTNSILNGDNLNEGFRFPGDDNGDMKDDIVNIQNSLFKKSISMLSNDLHNSNLMVKIKDGSGGNISIEYKSIFDGPDAIKAEDSKYPYISNKSSRYLATKMTVTDGRESSYSTNYYYYNAKLFSGIKPEKKDLLFEKVITINQSGEKTITEFIQDKYHLHGCPKRVEQYADNGTFIKTVDYQYYDNTITLFGTYISHIKSVVQNNYDASSTTPVSTGIKSYVYDGYGNTLRVDDSITNAETITTINKYDIDESSWLLRRLSETSILSNNIEIKREKYNYSGNNLESNEIFHADNNNWIKQSYVYDSNGNIIKIFDPLGHVSTVEYDSDYRSYPIIKTNAINQSVYTTYDYRFGEKSSETDSNGSTIRYEYDEFGRLVKTVNPGDEWSSTVIYNITGDPNTQYIETHVADESSSGFHYKRQYMDALGRVYKIIQKAEETDAFTLEQEVDIEFNEHGQKNRETMPYLIGSYNESPLYIKYKYDSLNRLILIDYPDNTSKKFIFANEGDGEYSETLIDRDGTMHKLVRNARNRVIKKIDSNIVNTSYSYNNAGLLSLVTYTDGLKTMIEYDSLGRKVSICDPNTGISSYSYNDAGYLLSSHDAMGNTVSYEYDAINRIKKIHHPEGTADINYYYDDPSIKNSRGRVTKITDGVSESTFAYDGKGQIIIKTQKIDGMKFIFQMEYDKVGRVARLTYPDGTAISRQYANLGYLKNVDWNGYSIVQYGRFKEDKNSSIRNIENRVYRITGDGVETNILYNPATTKPERIVSKKNYGSGDVIEDVTYEYNVSNITSITDNLDNSKSQTFAYDSLNRLISADGVYGHISYNYANNGNLRKKGDLVLNYNDSSHPYAVTSDSVGNNYLYDDNGNMICRKGSELVYDSLNRLMAIKNNGNNIAIYNYDHTNHRIKKTLGNGTVIYNIENLYEITRIPQYPDLHTKYFYGVKNELVAQMTMENSQLLSFNNPSVINSYYAKNNLKGLILFTYEYLNYLSNNKKTYRYFIYVTLLLGFFVLLTLTFKNIIIYKSRIKILPVWAIKTVPVLCFTVFASYGLFGCSNMISDSHDNGESPWNILIYTDVNLPSGTPVPGMMFFHPDYNRNISYVTNAQGEKIYQAYYKPYGEISEMSGRDVVRYKFNSHEHDQESGLMYYNARYYDSNIGRFITPDTIVFDPGQSQTSNRYMYVVGNPIALNDATGNSPESQLYLYAETMMANWSKWSEQESQKSLGVQFCKSIINSFTGIFSWIEGGYKGFLSGWITNLINYPGFSLSYSYNAGWGVTGGLYGRYYCISWGNGFHWQEKGPNGGWSIYGTVSLSYEKLSVGLATSYNFNKHSITNNLRVSLSDSGGAVGIGYTWINNARNGHLLGGRWTAYGGINLSGIIGPVPTSLLVRAGMGDSKNGYSNYIGYRFMDIKQSQAEWNNLGGPSLTKAITGIQTTASGVAGAEYQPYLQVLDALIIHPIAVLHDYLCTSTDKFGPTDPSGMLLCAGPALTIGYSTMFYNYNYQSWLGGF